MLNFFQGDEWLILALILWTLPWKGVALWKSARLSQRNWFIALLILNTVGVLEILYIFIFSKKGERALIERNNG